jgi:transcriptional regulator with XRE-family HTH domain
MPARKRPKPGLGRGSGAPDPIDVQLGAKVRELRKSRGLSQAQVAEIIGLTFQQVQKYEHAGNRISVSTLLRLSRALDMSASAIIAELAGESAHAEVWPNPAGSLSASRALLKVNSEPVKAAVIELLKAIAVASGSPARVAKGTAGRRPPNGSGLRPRKL